MVPARRPLTFAALLAALSLAACAGPAPRAPAPSGATGTPVAELASRDFVRRARAAELLVAAGEGALPSLGAAGDQPVGGPGGVRSSTTAPVLRAILADLPPERVRVALGSSWPVVRRAAAEELGRRGSWSAVPILIDGTEDPDGAVRAACSEALLRLTNLSFGFEPHGPERARAAATARWREWWRVTGRLEGDRRDPGAG